MSSEILEQGLVKKCDNKDDDTKQVEDTNMRDQDDIDNHNVNINCKENDVVVEVNEVNKVNVNNNYERIEVVEECNDENKSVKDDLKGDLREQIKTSLSNKEVSTLLVVSTTYKKTILKHA